MSGSDFLFPESATNVICDSGEVLAYSQLVQRAGSIDGHVERGSLVLCMLDNTIGGLLGYVAFVYGASVALVVGSETTAERIGVILQRYRPEYCWVPDDKVETFGASEVVTEDGGHSLLRTEHGPGPAMGADLCLLASTSGSTGSPTFVRQSRTNVLANTRAIVEYLDLTGADRALTSLPIHYTFGMSILNTQIAAGGDIVLTDKSWAQREFWARLSDCEVSVLSGVPYTYEMFDRMRVFRKDLPHVRKLLQAGGKIGEPLQARIAEYAEKYDKQFFIMYGQTEATTRMAYLPPGRCADKIGSIGLPIPGGRIEIVDEEGLPIVTPGEVGEMVYHGANVCLGYAEGREDLSLGDVWQGRLVTGDLACRDEEGFLYIKGRKKRIVKHYGMRVSLDELEEILKALFPGSGIACVEADDELVIYADRPLDLEEVTTRLTAETQIRRGGFRLEALEGIPTLANGKTDYQALKAR